MAAFFTFIREDRHGLTGLAYFDAAKYTPCSGHYLAPNQYLNCCHLYECPDTFRMYVEGPLKTRYYYDGTHCQNSDTVTPRLKLGNLEVFGTMQSNEGAD